MSKVSYLNLKLKTDTSTETIDWNNNSIEIKQYLPIEEKYNLVMVTLQEAKESNIYNPLKIDLFFHLNLVYMYTNINFTEKQKEDASKLYDNLMSSGLLTQIISKIPTEEYDMLYTYLENIKNDLDKYGQSFKAILDAIINELPEKASEAMKILESFNPEDYKSVIAFAKASNNGNPVA